MKMCSFPGCQHLGGHGGPHGRWDATTQAWVPLAEQRTPAEQMRERRAKINREKAERIAAQVMEDMTGTESLHGIATAAALAALTETENAR